MEAIAGLHAPAVNETGTGDRDKTVSGKTGADDGPCLLQAWLNVHVVRSLLADVPGWLYFAAGFLLQQPFQ